LKEKIIIEDSEKPFEGILGNSSEVKIIEHLMSCPHFEFTINDIMEQVGVSRPSASEVIKKFIKWNMVIKTKEVGNTRFYQLNDRSGLAILLTDFSDELIRLIIREEELEVNPSIANYPIIVLDYKIQREYDGKQYSKEIMVGAAT